MLLHREVCIEVVEGTVRLRAGWVTICLGSTSRVSASLMSSTSRVIHINRLVAKKGSFFFDKSASVLNVTPKLPFTYGFSV